MFLYARGLFQSQLAMATIKEAKLAGSEKAVITSSSVKLSAVPSLPSVVSISIEYVALRLTMFTSE